LRPAPGRLAAALVAMLAVAPGAASPQAVAPSSPLTEAESLLEQGRAKEAVVLAKTAVEEQPQNGHAWFLLARATHAAGDFDDAIKAGHRASEFAAVRASAFYNLACAYALRGDKESALKALLGAKRAGFADRDQMAQDPDLATLRDDPRFVLPVQREYFTLKLSDGSELPFSVDLPVDFDPKRAYPVLIAPGPGKKVEGDWGGLYWGEDTSQRGWMAVESTAFLLTDPIGATALLLDEVARRYQVEGGKFHFACYGPSSGPAFGAAMAYPQRVKSLVALPGFPVTDKEDELEKLVGIRVSFIVGEMDRVWLQEAQVAYNRLKALGVDAYLEIVPNGGHILQDMFGGELATRLELLR
jgi:hypothetical protein